MINLELKNPLYKNIGAHVITAIFTIDKGEIKVLLIKRTNEPFKEPGLYQVEQCTTTS